MIARALACRPIGPAEPQCLSGAQARAFLLALPLHAPAFVLPADVLDRLDELGVRTAGSLAGLPRAGVALRFDATVLALWDLLTAMEEPPLRAWMPPDRLVARSRSDEALEDRLVLEQLLRRLAGEIAAQLGALSRAAACLTLRVHRTGGAVQIARASAWAALYTADTLARAALPLLERCLSLPTPQAVEELVLEAAELGPAPTTQAALFGDPLSARRARLDGVLEDQVRLHGTALLGRWRSDPVADDGWRHDDWTP
jgi:protein ImuB